MSDFSGGNRKDNAKKTAKKTYRIAVALTSVTQTALSLLVPTLTISFAARYLTKRFALPQFVPVLGIVLGVVCGFYSSFKYITSAAKSTDRKDEE